MYKFIALLSMLIACVSAKPGLAYSSPFVAAHSSQVVSRQYNGIAAPLLAAPAFAPAIAAVSPYYTHPAIHHASYAALPHAHAHASYAALPHIHAHASYAALPHAHAHASYAALPHSHAHASYAAVPHAHSGYFPYTASLTHAGLHQAALPYNALPHAHISHTSLAQAHHLPYAAAPQYYK